MITLKSEISKRNYSLELVEGEPRSHILGLPHTVEGYEEAKRILELTCGKNIKVLKALMKDLETLPNITSLTKVKEIYEFYNQLSRTVRAINTDEEIAQCTKLCLQHYGQVRTSERSFSTKG